MKKSNKDSVDPFTRLYNNAMGSKHRKDVLKKTLDHELGISFSPSFFKSPKHLNAAILLKQ